VAIVTDGSAVLGLGNIGPIGALPVMEGKALLFKKFAAVDAVPICLNVHSTEEIVNHVLALAPGFGGINLEDIAAPLCFEIEHQLRQKLDIPIFHDDQHGTAIVTLAGLFNALQVRQKKLKEVTIVINGAGAAGTAITHLLLKAGARDIVVCDRQGALHPEKVQPTQHKKWLAEHTNPQQLSGPLREVIKGADVFIGVSGPGLLDRNDVQQMQSKPIVFALANPEPEINPMDIQDIAGVIATGRSDYPNQVNNVLAFPGIFKGALECFAREINSEMCLDAAKALSQAISLTELSAENIIPSIFQKDLSVKIAEAVISAAQRTGVSRIHTSDDLSFDYLSCFPNHSGQAGLYRS
jgi:malate dehydrogenase (oxaloacetate-decarboxylating)